MNEIYVFSLGWNTALCASTFQQATHFRYNALLGFGYLVKDPLLSRVAWNSEHKHTPDFFILRGYSLLTLLTLITLFQIMCHLHTFFDSVVAFLASRGTKPEKLCSVALMCPVMSPWFCLQHFIPVSGVLVSQFQQVKLCEKPLVMCVKALSVLTFFFTSIGHH